MQNYAIHIYVSIGVTGTETPACVSHTHPTPKSPPPPQYSGSYLELIMALVGHRLATKAN